MRSAQFVEALAALTFDNTFNPYSCRCVVHDLDDAPRRRSSVLLAMLSAAEKSDVDSIWVGRDLGYRGGRRTGLALTDDLHVATHARRWGIKAERPTKGKMLKERTAGVVWNILGQIDVAIFLWNVFPLHPHEPTDHFTNRSHNAVERRVGEEILFQLITLLRPHRLVAIGNDAMQTVSRLASKHEIIQVRHPSYGGQTQFVKQIQARYALRLGCPTAPQFE